MTSPTGFRLSHSNFLRSSIQLCLCERSHGKDQFLTVFTTLILNTSHRHLLNIFIIYTGRCEQWYWCLFLNGTKKVLWIQSFPPKR